MEKNGNGPGSSSPPNICFGPFELDIRAAELRKEGRRIRLQDQPFQILRMLLESPGEVVLREEIRQRLWPNGTVVEFDHSINAAVKRLRDTLLDAAESPRYIETLARRGYRFIGTVEKEADEAPLAVKDEPSTGSHVFETGIGAPSADGSSQSGKDSGEMKRRPTQIAAPALLAGTLLLVFLLVLAGVRLHSRGAPARWAREVALPEATRLVSSGKYTAAVPLIYRALQVLPEDSALQKLRREISYPVTIRTTPSGSQINLKPYGAAETEWLPIGTSPIENFLLPVGYYQFKVTKPGFRTLDTASGIDSPNVEFTLDKEGSLPAEMVHVPSGVSRLFGSQPILDHFFLDRYEVTNKQFKEFVEHGGYQDRHYWREKFVKDGHVLSWEHAMEHFRDATGRPGPSTWEVGDYPPGRAEFPVSGVSWYEASAYAEFAKKQLPTIYHWYRGANQGIHSDILMFSNFGGSGPVAVGSRPSLGAFGTYDIAGNVKEWCSNAAAGERRYILGGSWNEGRSYFVVPDALTPFDRSSTNGFRCVRYPGGPLPEVLNRPVDKPKRNYLTETPVSDGVFRILKGFYAYDRSELNVKHESVDDASEYWRVERITFDAAYDQQRVTAFLYLPKNGKGPYQTIVFWPSGHARQLTNIDDAEMKVFDFVVKSGRAVVLPVYQGTYERRHTIPRGPSGLRDLVIQQSRDFRRSLDYLETRKDIVHDRIAFLGMSGGSRMGLINLADEPRVRTAVLWGGGLSSERTPPETDEINFVPRVRIPVLMINGRDDFVFPVETAQIPMLRFLGSPEKDKRNVLFDTGHAAPTRLYIKETLDWFDRYLGPVSK